MGGSLEPPVKLNVDFSFPFTGYNFGFYHRNKTIKKDSLLQTSNINVLTWNFDQLTPKHVSCVVCGHIWI